jgi:hypothetical protein
MRVWRVLMAGLAAAAITLASCSRLTPGASKDPQRSSFPASAVPAKSSSAATILTIDALNDATAWVLTDEALDVTSDAGKSWSTLGAAEVSGGRAFVALDHEDLFLGALTGPDGLDATVRTSTDGGLHWQESKLAVTGQPGDVGLAAGSAVVAALIVQTTSVNASSADLFISEQGGAFSKRSAPAAGSLSITGPDELWLAGGVMGNQLWGSSDNAKTWTEVRLPPDLGPEISAGVPIRIGGSLLLPVTINGASTKVAVLGTADGGITWHPVVTIAVGGDSGMGVPLPVAVAADRLIVAGPAGGLFAITSTGEALAPISPNGLSPNVTALRFASASAGWAVVTDRGCDSGKSNCHVDTRLFFTSDAGQTWNEVTLPS